MNLKIVSKFEEVEKELKALKRDAIVYFSEDCNDLNTVNQYFKQIKDHYQTMCQQLERMLYSKISYQKENYDFITKDFISEVKQMIDEVEQMKQRSKYQSFCELLYLFIQIYE